MDRGQIHTLEAFIVALMLVGGLLFATQATAVTPLSASTSNQHIENQHQAITSDFLSTTHSDGSLQSGLTYWDTESASFYGTEDDLEYYTQVPPEGNPLHDSFQIALIDRNLAVNVDIIYRTTSGEFESQEMVQMGRPTENAVTSTRTVVLYGDMEFSGGPSAGSQIGGPDSLYAPDLEDDSNLYNVVEVRITVWRM